MYAALGYATAVYPEERIIYLAAQSTRLLRAALADELVPLPPPPPPPPPPP
eukprot:SAG31_NODE_25018_length_469_cov_3.986486_1_plen_50_part_10